MLIRALRKISDPEADQWEYSHDSRTILRPNLLSDVTFKQAKVVAKRIACL